MLLVLLVIVMAAIPLSQRGLDATLPPTAQGPDTASPPSEIVVEYTADKKLSINRGPVALRDLEQRLRDIYRDGRDKTPYVSGAGTLRYGDIVAVIDAAKGRRDARRRHHRGHAPPGRWRRIEVDRRT